MNDDITTLNPPDVVKAYRKQPRPRIRATPVVADGVRFDSQVEHRRYLHLLTLQAGEHINGLQCHPKYKLQDAFRSAGGNHRAITYTPDFQYTDRLGRLVVEDVKGRAPDNGFHVKRKLWQQRNPHALFMVVREVKGTWEETSY